MRLKLGRPGLSAHAARFDVPPAGSGLSVTFLGVSTLLFDDGESAVMTDGFFSRPGLLRVALGTLAPETDRFPGSIGQPLVPPARAGAYKCGEAWSLLAEHAGGRSALVQGSAGYKPGALRGRRADVAYLGVGQLGHQDESYIRASWRETVEAVGARRVVLIHWDDFFRPLDEPLRALPFTHDDLDATIGALARLAHDQRVRLHLPTAWRREDLWTGLD